MAARATAVSGSRTFVRQLTRASHDPAKPFVFAIATRARCLHTTAPSCLAATTEHELTPGATYVHIPPLEIPASGLVPLEGSVDLRVKCVDRNGHPVSTVAHSLAIAKAVEAKCGPIVSISHRRDPRNGTLLIFMYITLLHPITLTKELGLEIPCHRIPWEHRAAGGPSLEEVERAILEPPGISSPSNSHRDSSSRSQDNQNSASKARTTQNEEHDIVFARVSMLPAGRGSSPAHKYGVTRQMFNASRARKVMERRRGTKSPEEEKEEDQQILARLTEWKGFYGGFEPLQAIYQPFRPVLQAQTTVKGVEKPFKSTAAQPKEHQAQQQEEDKRTLEQRLEAEKAYWRSRREAEKQAKRDDEKSTAAKASSPGTPSATLLQRLLKGENNHPSATAATSSMPSASRKTESPSPVQQSTPSITTPTNAPAPSPLNKAQARLVEQARLRAREESSRSVFPRSLLGSSLNDQKQRSSNSAVPGFHHMGSQPSKALSGKGSPSTKKDEEKKQSMMAKLAGLFSA